VLGDDNMHVTDIPISFFDDMYLPSWCETGRYLGFSGRVDLRVSPVQADEKEHWVSIIICCSSVFGLEI
jgi:hypothetical protein